AGEEMPACEKIRSRSRRPTGRRPRRARRHPRRGTALPQARRLYPRLALSQAMLLLWVVISAALLTVGLVLNSTDPRACIWSRGPRCPPPPQHADASGLMNLRLRAEAFPHRQPTGCAIGQLEPQAHMIGNACPRANGGSGSPPGRLPAVSAAPSNP